MEYRKFWLVVFFTAAFFSKAFSQSEIIVSYNKTVAAIEGRKFQQAVEICNRTISDYGSSGKKHSARSLVTGFI